MATLAQFFILAFHIIGTLSSVLPDESQPNTCMSCCQGPAGLPGVPGSAGIPGSHGLAGRDGLKGEIGMKGEVGSIGVPGERGPPGPRGPSGERGDPGLQGLPGKVGPGGIDGRPGADGQTGAVGQPGPVGPKGSKGDSPQVRKSAFSVFRTTSQTGYQGDILTFNSEQTNLGSHFSMTTNKFTCQIPGTYIFMFTVSRNTHNHNPGIALMKDGTEMSSVHIRDSNSDFQQSSNTVVLQLAVGNQVWLQFIYSGTRQVYSDIHKYTSFSGFLLYAE